jgi:hypothetical protein
VGVVRSLIYLFFDSIKPNIRISEFWFCHKDILDGGRMVAAKQLKDGSDQGRESFKHM